MTLAPKSVDALIDEIVPSDIRLANLPAIEESKTEVQALADLKASCWLKQSKRHLHWFRLLRHINAERYFT